jgi:aconitate hydratase
VVGEIAHRAGQPAHPRVSLDVNPTSRQILENLAQQGYLLKILRAGARLHQAGCNGCIGMGQAPATDEISLRTVPRNFPGRSGTREDKVHLCSPETAIASALTGVITDPRDLENKFSISYPRITEPDDGEMIVNESQLVAPLPEEEARSVEIRKGPNIASIPDMQPIEDELELEVLLKVGDDVSTDEILPAGTRVLPYRSNIPKISEFTFDIIDEDYDERALEVRDSAGGHIVVGGSNYGQGSSREHAALAPRYLGLKLTIVKDYSRIHWQNLVNFGVLPLTFADDSDHDGVEQGDVLKVTGIHEGLDTGTFTVENTTQGTTFQAEHQLSERQVEVMRVGGIINWMKERLGADETSEIETREEGGPPEELRHQP